MCEARDLDLREAKRTLSIALTTKSPLRLTAEVLISLNVETGLIASAELDVGPTSMSGFLPRTVEWVKEVRSRAKDR